MIQIWWKVYTYAPGPALGPIPVAITDPLSSWREKFYALLKSVIKGILSFVYENHLFGLSV